MAARNFGQYCGVVTAVELVGERWALLIVRDLLVGARRYGDLKNGLPRIPTNILSSRLKELQHTGVVRRVPLAHGLVYELTEFGRGLEDVVLALGRWGFQAMGDPQEGDIVTPDSMTMAFRTAFQADAAGALPPTVYDAHIADFALRLHVDDSNLRVLRLGQAPRGTAHLAFASGPALRKRISGEVAPAEAVEQQVVQVLSGDPALLGRFAQTFHLPTRPVAAA
jgi:DNA-binding HxlR family transcriptional regulator